MALFASKTEEKEETKFEVSKNAGKAGPSRSARAEAGAPFLKIPTILIQPRISEKSGHLVKLNKYVFKVKIDANKVEVKKAVEAAYKVKVTQVNIVRNLGKSRNFNQRAGKTQAFKKAIVTLKKGDSIEGLTDVV